VQRQKEDVTDRLPRIAVPTLVLQALEDEAVGFAEGRLLASMIPNASFVALDSRNHILLAEDPAWPVFVREVAAFVSPDRDGADPAFAFDELTARELEILRLAAAGRDNGEIADSLVLSVRTVERHLSNAYLKLGVSGRAARAAAVADLVRRGLA
jgi:DNA-binding NarL/FixJ family response regulator